MAITATRRARVEIDASSRGMDKALREARQKLKALAADESRIKKEAARNVARQNRETAKKHKDFMGGVSAKGIAGSMLGIGAAMAGGVALGSIAEDVGNVERALTRYQIAANRTPGQMEQFRKDLTQTSQASGLAREEILKGASAYVALTGDADGAKNAMSMFANVSNATGASMDDIASTAAAMKQNLKIDPKDFEAAFSALHVQGKAGAVEIRELAHELAGVAPSFAQFKGGKGVSGLIQLGAALQAARQGFGSTSEAATGMQSLIVALQKKAGAFEAHGIKIFDKDPKTHKKTLRDLQSIIDGIAKSSLAKDPKLLTKAFGRDEARRTYDQLVANRALMQDLIAQGSDSGAIARDAATYQESSAGRLDKAWNNIKLSIESALTPERVRIFASAIEGIAAAVEKTARLIHGLMITEDEDSLNQQINQKRAEDIAKIQKLHAAQGRFVTPAQAEQQYLAETSQLAMLREGVYDKRSAGDLLGMRSSIVERGSFLKQSDFLANLDVAIGKALAREMTSATAPLTNALRLGAGIPGAQNIVVKIGLDEIARAHGNAKTHRTRPGGR